MVIDQGTEFGARVARRLREQQVVWLTTVTPAGSPLPRPVGFVWDGGDVVSVYSQPGAYAAQIAAFGMTPASYAAGFSIPIRIRLMRVEGR